MNIHANRLPTNDTGLDHPLELDLSFIADAAITQDAEALVSHHAAVGFDASQPEIYREENIQQAERELDRANAVVEQARNKRDWQTQRYEVEHVTTTGHPRSMVEVASGWVACAVELLIAVTIPTLASLMIVESNKVALLADIPALGGIFGAAALAAILCATGIRNNLHSDRRRAQLDLWLSVGAACAFILWLATFSLLVFNDNTTPAVSNGGGWEFLLENDPGTEQEPAPTTEGSNLWALFFVTGLLELLAAPALHRLVVQRLEPKAHKVVSDDPEYERLSTVVLPSLLAERDQAENRLERVRKTREARNNARERHIQHAIILLRSYQSEIDTAATQARSKAHAQIVQRSHQELRAQEA